MVSIEPAKGDGTWDVTVKDGKGNAVHYPDAPSIADGLERAKRVLKEEGKMPDRIETR